MRFETPVPAVNRHPQEDIDLGDGLIVRKARRLHCLVAAANLDADAFPEPLTWTSSGPGASTSRSPAAPPLPWLPPGRLELRVAVEELLLRSRTSRSTPIPARLPHVVIRMPPSSPSPSPPGTEFRHEHTSSTARSPSSPAVLAVRAAATRYGWPRGRGHRGVRHRPPTSPASRSPWPAGGSRGDRQADRG